MVRSAGRLLRGKQEMSMEFARALRCFFLDNMASVCPSADTEEEGC
jgi:hypothetical protein